MDMVFGKETTMSHILANGRNQKLMVMVFILGKTEIVMKASGEIA